MLYGNIIPAEMMEPPEPPTTLVPTIVEIDLVRHDAHIFYNRRENGRSIVTGQRVPLDRARQIYEANQENDWQRRNGLVSFDPAPGEWSWTTRIAI